MSVVVHNDEQHAVRSGTCLLCGVQLHPPYLEWNAIRICGSCCRTIKHGFMADLVHVVAVVELRELGYRGETFMRRDHKGLGDALRAHAPTSARLVPLKPKDDGDDERVP